MEQICNDLATEQQELDAVVANLDEAGWKTMTPSSGWDIKEQIRHLAYYENRAKLATSNPEAFQHWLEQMLQDPDAMTKHMETTGKDLTAGETLKWWREERSAFYPPWQGMQYMHNMFSGRAKLGPLDNDRYPGIRWTTARDVLAAREMR